jgi:hypothetical protein
MMRQSLSDLQDQVQLALEVYVLHVFEPKSASEVMGLFLGINPHYSMYLLRVVVHSANKFQVELPMELSDDDRSWLKNMIYDYHVNME